MEPSELKVVVNLKENRVVIGVSAPGCDPYLSPGIVLEGGDFEARLKEVLIQQEYQVMAALEQWAESKRYPRYVKPTAEKSEKKGKAGKTQARGAAPVAPAQAVATEESPTRTPELPLLGGPSEPPAEPPQETPGDAPEEPETPTQEEGPQEASGHPSEEPETSVPPTAQEHQTNAQEGRVFRYLRPGQEATEESEAPTAQAERGGWVYHVKASGAGPFKTVHEALLAHGVSQQEIGLHKWWHRWDRLPKKLQDAIEKRKIS